MALKRRTSPPGRPAVGLPNLAPGPVAAADEVRVAALVANSSCFRIISFLTTRYGCWSAKLLDVLLGALLVALDEMVS